MLIEAINNVSTARGTAIGSAILTSIDGIAAIDPTVAPTGIDAESAQRSGYAPHVIVVLTDGANTQGVEPAEASEAAAVRGVRVFTIGFGTTDAHADGVHRPAGRRLGRRRSGWRLVGRGGGRSPRIIDEDPRCRPSPRPPEASTTGPRAPTSCRRRWVICPAR